VAHQVVAPVVVRAFVLFLFSGLVLACAATPENKTVKADVSEPDAISSGYQVAYELEWMGEDQLTIQDDGAWSTENDLGYMITLSAGYMVTYSSELVECSQQERVESARAGFYLLRLMDAFISPAFAGHSELEPNPAAIKAPLAEQLTPPQAQTLGTVTLASQLYCNVHYLVARSDDKAQWLPEDVDLYRQSLYLRGSYLAPDATESVPFEILSALGNGVISPLYPQGQYGVATAALQHNSGDGDLTVRIRRDLGTLFDQLDFRNMSDEELARQTLKNIVNNVEIVLGTEDSAD
jgi:hypothetical protein